MKCDSSTTIHNIIETVQLIQPDLAKGIKSNLISNRTLKETAIMASSDPHPQGGDLSDMAAEGTTIPGDAGKMNLIPSVPRPDQIEDPNELGSAGLEGAADNATDIPRVSIHDTMSR